MNWQTGFALLSDRVQYAVSWSRAARTNAILKQGLRPGTMGGKPFCATSRSSKASRLFFVQRSMGRELYGRWGRYSWNCAQGRGQGRIGFGLSAKPASEMSNFAGGTRDDHYLRLWSDDAKQLLAGKTPRELLDENSPLAWNWKTFWRLLVQGGGLASSGDFCLGRSRDGVIFGGSFGGLAYSKRRSRFMAALSDARDGRDPGANSFRSFSTTFRGVNFTSARPGLYDTQFILRVSHPGYLRRCAAAWRKRTAAPSGMSRR